METRQDVSTITVYFAYMRSCGWVAAGKVFDSSEGITKPCQMSLRMKYSEVRVKGNNSSSRNSSQNIRALPLIAKNGRFFASQDKRCEEQTRSVKCGRRYKVERYAVSMEKDVELPRLAPKGDKPHLGRGKCAKMEVSPRNNIPSKYRCGRIRCKRTTNAGKKTMPCPTSGSSFHSSKRNPMKRLSDSLGILRIEDGIQSYNVSVREKSLDIRRIALSPRQHKLGSLVEKERQVLAQPRLRNEENSAFLLGKTSGNTKSEAKLSAESCQNGAAMKRPNFHLTPLEKRCFAYLSPSPSLSEQSLDSCHFGQSQAFQFSPSPPSEKLEVPEMRSTFPTLRVTPTALSGLAVSSSLCFSEESLDSFLEGTYALSPPPPSDLSSRSLSEASIRY